MLCLLGLMACWFLQSNVSLLLFAMSLVSVLHTCGPVAPHCPDSRGWLCFLRRVCKTALRLSCVRAHPADWAAELRQCASRQVLTERRRIVFYSFDVSCPLCAFSCHRLRLLKYRHVRCCSCVNLKVHYLSLVTVLAWAYPVKHHYHPWDLQKPCSVSVEKDSIQSFNNG